VPILYLEAVSKIEKWFEVKPPARRAYAPEGTVQDGRTPFKFPETHPIN